MRIQKVGVLSLGKIVGVVLAAVALVPGSIVAVFAVVGAAASLLDSGGLTFGAQELMMLALGIMIGGPVVYGLMGFAVGVVSALAYNFMARQSGGLELEIE